MERGLLIMMAAIAISSCATPKTESQARAFSGPSMLSRYPEILNTEYPPIWNYDQAQFERSIEVNAWPGAPRYFVPSPWPGGTYKPYGYDNCYP